MRLTQLRSFYAVAHAGGFTAPAKLCRISQPTVTTQNAFLSKRRTGCELFYRSGHKVTLTPLGGQLFEIAQKIFELESETVHLLEGFWRVEVGALARRRGRPVPCHRDAGALQSAPSPDAGIGTRRQLRDSAAILGRLSDGCRGACAISTTIHDSTFFHTSRHPIVIFMHRKHRFARRKSIRIRELEGEGMILREVGSTTRKALDDALIKAGVTPGVVMEIGGRKAIREAVIKGVGIGAVSEIEFIPDPQLETEGEGE